MKEIERKFLVTGDNWKRFSNFPPVLITQYYFKHKNPNIRLRIEEDSSGYISASIAFKYKTENKITRNEYEFFNLDEMKAKELAKQCNFGLIKQRYHVVYAKQVIDLDVYTGKNKGLITMDIELEHKDQKVRLPKWAEKEITGFPEYSNYNLSYQIEEN